MATPGDSLPEPPPVPLSSYTPGLKQFEADRFLDILSLAFWSVSSAKQNKGVEQLRNDDPSLFWELDGSQPHYVDAHFAKRVHVAAVAVYVHYALDELYTPARIAIMAGNGEHSLWEVATLELEEPTGWCSVAMPPGLSTFYIRAVVTANHQNGKDTHIRDMRVLASRGDEQPVTDVWRSLKLLSESTIR